MLRTGKNGDQHLERWDWVIVAAATVLIPSLIGLLAWGVFAPFMEQNPDRSILTIFVAYLVAQIWMPVGTIVLAPLALLPGLWALRKGWAGWASAILAPVSVITLFMFLYAQTDTGYAPWVYYEPTIFLGFTGALHGLVMWLALRWRRPEALATR